MRVFLPVLALLLVFAFSIQAQMYHPLLQSGRTWDIGYAAYGAWGAPMCTHSGAYRNYLSGDTVVNGKVYQKLYQQEYTSSTGAGPLTFCPPYYFTSPFTGQASGPPQLLVREDTASKRVYTLNTSTWPNPGIEDVLFDFSLQPADTFVVTHSGQPIVTNTVFAIDTISTGNGQPRKRFHFGVAGMPVLYFIEGIGGASGFTNPVPPFEWSTDLLCVRDALGNVEFSGDYCNYVLAAEKEAPAPYVSISPNPASDFVTLKVSGHSAPERASVKLLDQFGRPVWAKPMLNEEEQLDTRLLPNGIYFMCITGGQKELWVERLVVLH